MRTLRGARRVLMVGAAAGSLVVGTAVAAQAHTPVRLGCSDVVPWMSPEAVNGTNPVLFFGSLSHSWSVRSFQEHYNAGDPLILGLGIPDKAPENALATAALPTVYQVAPDGKVTQYAPNVRIPLHADETNQDYLMLNLTQGTATETGVYSFIVAGGATERFFAGTGVEGGPFDGVLRGTVATIDQLDAWYNTPASPMDCPL
ncbi:hypothetical protein [Catenulispora rubra]|uniref:hypothetical protein n=1 Tax=Catenulispora rubra TaxID=280293 RepID=UPI0018921AFE|nr:hypothetical protein [Catenulispora rubra]